MRLSEVALSARITADRIRHRLVVGAVTAIFAVIACVFAGAALFLAIAAEIGGLGACLAMSAVFGLLAVLGVLIGRRSVPKSPHSLLRPPAVPPSETVNLGLVIATFLAAFDAARKRPPSK